MKTITCHRVDSVSDTGESLAARFSNRDAADKAAPHVGGYPPGRIHEETIVIYDTVFEWRPTLDVNAARSGLAKLTFDERAALGLSDVKV